LRPAEHRPPAPFDRRRTAEGPRRAEPAVQAARIRRRRLSRRRRRVRAPPGDGPLERALEVDRLQTAGPVAQRFEIGLRRLDRGAPRQAAAASWSELEPALP